MLGTVQFGMPYGVANSTGQPTYPEVVRIIAKAIEGGVNCFDTAAAYGSSEAVLGRALQELRIADKVTVVTKVRPLTAQELKDPGAAATAIENSIESSRRLLQIDSLPLVLFHREADATYLTSLEALRDRGRIQRCGVSCDNSPGPAAAILATRRFAAIQLPGSVVDERHVRSGICEMAQHLGVAVFIRSVFLQGLLLMKDEEIPPSLRDIAPVRRTLTALAEQAGMTLRELAVRFMLHQHGVTCVIAGVETVAQVSENVELFRGGPLPPDLLAAIHVTVCELPESLITPRQWPTRS